MSTLTFRDECTARKSGKPDMAIKVVAYGPVRVVGDAIYQGDRVIATRVEPVGFGDVHWEVIDGDDRHRFTTVEVGA